MTVLQHLKLVGERISFRNRTLCNTIHAVHLHSAELAQAMPVNCSTIGTIVVLDMNHKFVTPAGFDQRSGICLVEDLTTRLLETVCIDLGKDHLGVRILGSPSLGPTYREISINLEPVLQDCQLTSSSSLQDESDWDALLFECLRAQRSHLHTTLITLLHMV